MADLPPPQFNIVQSKMCDSCVEQKKEGTSVDAMFHCCSECNVSALKCTIKAAKAAFTLWQLNGGVMPPIEFLQTKPLGDHILLPNGSYMGPPTHQVQKVISMLRSGNIDRDITLICTILSLFDNAVNACNTDQERLLAQNKILLGFLISVISQSQYDAQNSQ